MKNDKMHT